MNALPRARGFVLVATLWILAIVTIAASYFAERVSRSMELATRKQQTADALVAFADTRAELIFRLATGYPTHAGIGMPPLAVDDRAYRGMGDDVVRVQDNQGLINLNFAHPLMLSRFLAQMGVPVERRDAMIDTLRDYIDMDDLRRLNGAEAPEYAAQGLPPPPNDWLASPYQLKNVIGWRENTDLWEKQHLLQFVTTSQLANFNPNTAPLEVLASLPGMTRDTARAAIALRRQQPFYGPEQIPGYVGGLIDPEFFVAVPGRSMRITQQSPRLPWALQFSLTLTPRSERAPWRVDYWTRTVVPYAIENEAEIPKLPPRSGTRVDAPPV